MHRKNITLRNTQTMRGCAPAQPASASVSWMALVSQIHDAASALDIDALKLEQEQAIRQFLQGRDVFTALRTGYGKSLRYFTLPPVFDRIRKVTNQSMC